MKLNCFMQLKQFYNIATKVSSRKKCYYFWWSACLLISLNSDHHPHHFRLQRGACIHRGFAFNSLVPEKFEWNFRHVIFKRILVIDSWGISCEIALIWMSLDFTDDQSTLVQVMAWCRQATSHYLSQCWPRSLSPYGVTRPQCLKCRYNVPSSPSPILTQVGKLCRLLTH